MRIIGTRACKCNNSHGSSSSTERSMLRTRLTLRAKQRREPRICARLTARRHHERRRSERVARERANQERERRESVGEKFASRAYRSSL